MLLLGFSISHEYIFFYICHYRHCEVSHRIYGLLIITYNITELLYENIKIPGIYRQAESGLNVLY